MSSKLGHRFGALVLGAVFVLTACTSTVGASSTSDDDDAPISAVNVWNPGPLDEFLIRIGVFSESLTLPLAERQKHADYLHRLQEGFIAACMAELGFDYYPAEPNIVIGQFDSEAGIPQETRWFAETYGFGISINPWGDTQLNQAAPSSTPNSEMLRNLSPSELEAWQFALLGDIGSEDWSLENGGCWGRAISHHLMYQAPTEFAGISEEVDLFWLIVESEPRTDALNRSWADCMGGLGHFEFANPQVVLDILFAEWSELQDWDALDDESSAWDWEADLRGPQWAPPDTALVEAFTDRERTIAVSTWDCRLQVSYDAELRTIELDLQQQFVDRHWAELEAWAQHEETRRANR